MKRLPLVLTVAAVLLGVGVAAAQEPLTRAERTDYRETSTLADVVAFLNQVVPRRGDMELTSLGTTHEGRDIPLVIVAPPHLRHPGRAHASGRLVVYLQANIHAGEVEGKESVQMLLREMADGKHDALLREMVLLVVPIYNVDGNERFSTLHRRNQVGPEGGVGQRPNARNLDLNRDYVKNDAVETRLSLAAFAKWDPHFYLDVHTTNGSKHRYALTYATCLHPNADRSVQAFADETLMPEVQAALRPEYEVHVYGNFKNRSNPAEGWVTSPWHARYGSNYYGLRGRFSLLVETYAYRDFRTRVDVSRKFVLECLRAAVRHKKKMLELTAAADRRLAAGAWKEMTIRCQRAALDKPAKLLGYEVQEGVPVRGRILEQDKPKDYEGPIFARYEATETIAAPAGYLIPRGLGHIARHVARHGVAVYRLVESAAIEVEAYRVEDLERQERPYQGRTLQKAVVTAETKVRAFDPGDFWVPTRQPLGRVAAELLEPRGEDGLLAWGFLDAFLLPQWGKRKMEVPVYRMMEPVEAPVRRFRLEK